MKTSSTKRMLAFWLAIAILGTPASGALAAEMAAFQPTAQAAEAQAEVKIAKTFRETILDKDLKKALIDAKIVTDADTVSYAVASDATSQEVLNYGNGTVTFKKVGTGTIIATITPATSASAADSTTKTQNITIDVKAINLSGAQIELSGASALVYDGKEKQPTVSKVLLDSSTLTPDNDYTISYANNKDAGTATVKATGKGNYTGTATTTFQIGTANLTNFPAISSIEVKQNADSNAVITQLNAQNIKADGVASEKVSGTFKLTGVVEKPSSKSSITPSDFTKKPGTYEVTATFQPSGANYNEKPDIKFDCTVTPAEQQAQEIKLTSATMQSKTKVYDGTTDVDAKNITVQFSPSAATPALGTDYTVSGTFADANVGDTKYVTVTVTLTADGQKKYTFADSKTTAETKIHNVSITKATPTKPEIKAPTGLKVGATVDDLQRALSGVNAKGVNNEKINGTLSLECESFGQEAKKYTVAYTFTPDPKWSNYVTTPLTGTFDCTIQAAASEDLSQLVTIENISAQPYTGSAIKPTPVLTGKVGLTEADYDVTYQNNTEVGTATVIVTFKGKYTGKVEKQFTIVKGEYKSEKTVSASVLKNKSQSFDLPKEIAALADVTFALKPQATAGTVVEKAEFTNKKLTVTTKAEATGTEDVVLTVKSKNYSDFDLIYKLTVVNKTDVSSKILFADKTVTHDAKAHKLDDAKLDSSVTAGANPKWTYTYTKVGTKDATDTSKVPEFTEIGVYQVTATYEDDKNFGQKTATLKIEEAVQKSDLTVSASQLDSGSDENYRNFSIRLSDETNGYVRIRADASDYLDRQKIDGTYSEWIGMEITPKLKGSAINMDSLYVSTNGGSWNKIAKGTYGNFYLDGVSGSSFYLWYDTNDKDRVDDLYLATDNTGANKFQIRVDFDAYSASSDSGSSGSTSSSTDKVNGDKVSTTTIDKTPSVKGNSATVSISISALSDALEKNKKESKNEKADKSYIKLDVKTSKSVSDTTVTVPVKSLDKISDADTGLSLVTNQGTVQMDHRALDKIVSAADKSEISFSIEEDKSNQYTLMVKDGSKKLVDLGSGEAELTFSYKLKSGEKASDVKVYRVGDGSKTWLSTYGGSTVYAGTGTYAAATGSYVTDMKADYNASKKKVTFATDALGTFLVTTNTLQTGGSNSGSNNTVSPSYSTFVDVPASRWSAQYINKLASMGVINGTGGGYFEPTLYVSREEFVKMLAGVAGANVSGYTSQRFPDVPVSRWSAPYIAWAVDHGITAGTDGGRFAPTMKITREEMATMIYRYTQGAGKVLPTKNVPTTFADAHRIDSWAQIPVSIMQQAGIIDGNVVNGRYSFDPKVPATREECAKMLCILHDLI